MTIQVTSNQRLGPGQTLIISDLLGVNIQPSSPTNGWSFNNAGTIIVDVNMPFIVVGVNFDYGSFHHDAVFTNEATGVFRVISRNGQDATFGLAGGHYGFGWNGDLVNAGLFEVSAVGYAAGVFTFDSTFSLINSGVLTVTSATDFAIGAWATNGGTYRNTGQIEVQGVRAYGLLLEKSGTITNGGDIRVRTTGPEPGIGLVVRNFEPAVIRIENTGLIEADIAILDQSFLYSPLQHSRQEVFNSGVIRGHVDLRHGDDDLVNAGLVDGRVDLGAGDDVYDGADGSTTGIVSGGAGADRLIGGMLRDVLVGDDGDDELIGGGGDDILAGGRGADRIDGGSGRDTVVFSDLSLGVELDLQTGVLVGTATGSVTGVEKAIGSGWADRLRGGSGANDLYGGEGNDLLEGRDGDDLLAGEGGDDILIGGAGADTFVFAVGGGNDVIKDFAPGVDRLQIHGYAGWREVRQDGPDVLLILSDTDSIRLEGLTVAGFGSASQSFASTAAPGIDAPDLGGTLLRSEILRVDVDEATVAGEVLVFRGPTTAVAVGAETAVRFRNDGHIDLAGSQSEGLTGVSMIGAGSGSTFVNGPSGLLEARATGSHVFVAGVKNSATSSRVENFGVIEVSGEHDAFGVVADTWAFAQVSNAGILRVNSGALGVGISAGQWAEVINSGLIEISGATSATGIRTSTNTPTVVNSGTIKVTTTTGTATGIEGLFGRLAVDNSGVIDATVAISSRFYDDRVDNTGTIVGIVSLGTGNDVVANHGRITGAINLGEGADRYEGSLSSHGATVNGDAGDDSLVGGRGDDTLAGGAGNDTIYGDQGADTLNGGDGQDKLYGGEGDDTLYGGLGDDLLEGGAGNDVLIANEGSNVVRGGAGTDTLYVSGASGSYRLLADGDDFILKGQDSVNRLYGVEFIRFDGGEIWDIARLFSEGPEVLPGLTGEKSGADGPLVLPGVQRDLLSHDLPDRGPGLLPWPEQAGGVFELNGGCSLTLPFDADWS
jgi:Ca2+-binding RTX toxin-like protein